MACRDYRIRKRRSKGQYILNVLNGYSPHESGYIQPTGKLEKREISKVVRRYKGVIPDGNWYKKLTSNFYWN